MRRKTDLENNLHKTYDKIDEAEELLVSAKAKKRSLLADKITQKMMATLYDVGLPTINEHIKKIYADSELEESATIRNFRIVQTEGSCQVTRDTKHYNLQMIIAVEFKVNNERAAKTTKQFFAKVQNKMHYAVHGHTAAELIYERADADKPHMGLTTWAAAPEGKIVKSDVSIAKNYLSEKEMRSLERIVSA